MIQEHRLEFRGGDLVAFDFDEFLESVSKITTEISVLTFFLSTMKNLPVLSIYAMSPVFSHPSGVRVSRVASGRFQ